MNIVQIHSGLGNQMFQYAFYRALKHHKPDTKIDTSVYRHRPSHNGYELERIFAITPDHATDEERNRLADVGKEWYAVVRRALGWTRRTEGNVVTEPDPANGWCEAMFEVENSYLQGYWQSERYFETIQAQIRQDFQFVRPLPRADEQMAQAMRSSQSVSVHIRRGDYLKDRRRADYEVCTDSYYRRALAYMTAHVDTPLFYVFSDDPDWCEAQDWFPAGTHFVRGHKGQEAYIDMQLMSQCKHHIIANSSFSWWGAWLGQTLQTLTIAPTPWFHFRARPDIIPARWVQIHAD